MNSHSKERVFLATLDHYRTNGTKYAVRPINMLWLDSPATITKAKTKLACYGILHAQIRSGAAYYTAAALDPTTKVCKVGTLKKQGSQTVTVNATLTEGERVLQIIADKAVVALMHFFNVLDNI